MTSLQKVFVKFWPIFNLLGFKIYSYKNLINNVDSKNTKLQIL